MEQEARTQLARLVRWVHGKGWTPGTGGNFASVLSHDPLHLLITPSGRDKGQIEPEDLLVIDSQASTLKGQGKPSAETLIHVAITRKLGVDVIVHIHSVWNTLASFTPGDEYTMSGIEMLKGLTGVTTHLHREQIPILGNSQDMVALSHEVDAALVRLPGTHGILLRGHGLYTWGHNIAEAQRHLETLEFLFELTVRAQRSEF